MALNLEQQQQGRGWVLVSSSSPQGSAGEMQISSVLGGGGAGRKETGSEEVRPTLWCCSSVSAKLLGTFRYCLWVWGMLGKEDVSSGPSPGSFHPNLFCAECWGGYWSHRGTNPGPSLEEEKKNCCPVMVARGKGGARFVLS